MKKRDRRFNVRAILPIVLFCALFGGMPAWAQTAPSGFPQIPAALDKKLAARASDVKVITLNKNLLNFGSHFMNPQDEADHEAQKFIHNLDGIYIRKYEFDHAGEYAAEDVREIQQQMTGPDWMCITEKSEKKEGTTKAIYIKTVNGQPGGMVIFKADPMELAFIYISGAIDLKDLEGMSGLEASKAAKSAKAGEDGR